MLRAKTSWQRLKSGRRCSSWSLWTWRGTRCPSGNIWLVSRNRFADFLPFFSKLFSRDRDILTYCDWDFLLQIHYCYRHFVTTLLFRAVLFLRSFCDGHIDFVIYLHLWTCNNPYPRTTCPRHKTFCNISSMSQ